MGCSGGICRCGQRIWRTAEPRLQHRPRRRRRLFRRQPAVGLALEHIRGVLRPIRHRRNRANWTESHAERLWLERDAAYALRCTGWGGAAVRGHPPSKGGAAKWFSQQEPSARRRSCSCRALARRCSYCATRSRCSRTCRGWREPAGPSVNPGGAHDEWSENAELGQFGAGPCPDRTGIPHDPLRADEHVAVVTGAFPRSDPSQSYPKLEYHVRPISLDAIGEPLRRVPAVTVCLCNLNARSCSRVQIRSAESRDAPVIAPQYRSTEADRQIAADSIRQVRAIVAQPRTGTLSAREMEAGHRLSKRCRAGPSGGR
jgi:hypothetical protein